MRWIPMPLCQFCQKENKREAIWAMQFIASDKPTFSALGWHERGFPVHKVCQEHCDQFDGHTAEEIQEMIDGATAAAANAT